MCQSPHQRIRIHALNTTLETDSSTFPWDIISSILCISCLGGVEDEKTANLFCVRRGIRHINGYQIRRLGSWESTETVTLPLSTPLRTMSNPLPLPWRKQDSTSTSQPNNFTAFLNDARTQFKDLPPSVVVLATFTLGSATAMSVAMIYKRFGRRIRNVDWVTPTLLNRKRWIKGVVTRSVVISLPLTCGYGNLLIVWFGQTIWSVGDADNFRLYHTPALGYSWPLKFGRIPTQKGSPHIFFYLFNGLFVDLKNETLSIRIAGVDAPEVFYVPNATHRYFLSIPIFISLKASHFGKPAQPYAAESLTWLREKILGKVVYCQLLRKDQYSRIVSHSQEFRVELLCLFLFLQVALVHLSPRILPGFLFYGKDLSAEMLKSGWAVTYAQVFLRNNNNYVRFFDINLIGWCWIRETGKGGLSSSSKSSPVRQTAYLLLLINSFDLGFYLFFRTARRGIWKYGRNVETPAEYKRRYAMSPDVVSNSSTSSPSIATKRSKKRSWWSRLFS